MAINQEWTKANEEKILNLLTQNAAGLAIETIGSDTNIFEPNLSWLLNRLERARKVRIDGYSPTYRLGRPVGTQAHYSLT